MASPLIVIHPEAIKRALAKVGAEFLGNDGVRLAKRKRRR
jgi:hypothetical protein